MSAQTDIGIAMRGGGYYSTHTLGAKAVIESVENWVRDALRHCATLDSGTLSMADFGAADGGTSMALMRRSVEFLRGLIGDRPITLTYTDLPDNDYSALFHLALEGEDALASRPGVFVFAAATSFHQSIFPPESLSFGFSATAMHWLSRLPGNIPGHTHSVGASGATLEAFRDQARRDWESILLHRARELRSGGRLVLVNFCQDEAGHYLGNTGGVNMHDQFNRHWRALLDADVISWDEYERTNFQQSYRTVAELRAPLEPGGKAFKAGLRLEACEARTVRCPYAAEYQCTGDAHKFASEYLGTLRSWSERVFLSGLSAERPLEERRAIVDRLYREYEQDVERSPQGHAMDYVHCYMVLNKQ
jgi:hypothetical protein